MADEGLAMWERRWRSRCQLSWEVSSRHGVQRWRHVCFYMQFPEDLLTIRILFSKKFALGLYSFPFAVCVTKLGLGTEFRSGKIPRKRLGTVSVIPRKKVLIPRHSEFRGRAHSEARNGTESKILNKMICPYLTHGVATAAFWRYIPSWWKN